MSKNDDDYEDELRDLQIELVKLQRHLITKGARTLIIVEGRDGAGKDGTIKRLTEHMSPRDTRIHAPGKPSDREQTQWYFQRFLPHLPAGGEFVVFNRSWYNRAGVERVMGFCTPKELEEFFDSVDDLEIMLMKAGVHFRKYYLDISREEQKERLAERRKDPLKQWKISPIDEAALDKWDAYTKARDDMFRRTGLKTSPWMVVRADRKKPARLAFLKDLLSSFDYPKKSKRLARSDGPLVFTWSPAAARKGLLAS